MEALLPKWCGAIAMHENSFTEKNPLRVKSMGGTLMVDLEIPMYSWKRESRPVAVLEEERAAPG